MYSQMLSKLKQSTPQPEIGEVVTVLAGNNAGQVIANNQGKYVLADRVYNIANYPDLYARIGSVGATVFTTVTSGTTSTLYTVTYGNGIYLTGGIGGALRRSTDGSTWSSVTSPTTATIWTLTYGNGLFVMGENNGSTGTIRSSTDGITWTTRQSFIARVVSGSYSQGIFIVGGVTAAYTSTNGTSWTEYLFASGTNVQEVLYANGRYLAFGTGACRTSTDAITWTSVTQGPTGGLGINSLSYGNGLYLCGENNTGLYTSTDSVTWTFRTGVGVFETIVYNSGLFVAGQGFGGMRTSTDGINWATRASGTSSNIWGLTYGNSLYVYVGNGGVLGTSADAITPRYSATYDANTQFYVPAFSRGSRFYTFTSYGSNTTPTFVNYVRAK